MVESSNSRVRSRRKIMGQMLPHICMLSLRGAMLGATPIGFILGSCVTKCNHCDCKNELRPLVE